MAQSTGFDLRSQQGTNYGGFFVNLENILIASYVCDFGNVIVGKNKNKNFRITNVGKLPVMFNFNKQMLARADIHIDKDKNIKIMPNSSDDFNAQI